jgi:hypothetical protein
VTLLWGTHLTPHERFFTANYHFYRTGRFSGREGGTAVAVRKGIPHKHEDQFPLASLETTGACIQIGNNEVLLASVYQSPGHSWNYADVTELLSFRHKLLLAGNMNGKYPFWNSVVYNHSGAELVNVLQINEFEISAPQCPTHYSPAEMVTCSLLLCTRTSHCQTSLSLIFWTQITYKSFSTYWIMIELGILRARLTNSQIWSGFKAWRTTGNFPRCTPVRDLLTAFHLLYVYNYTTKLWRQQAEVM